MPAAAVCIGATAMPDGVTVGGRLDLDHPGAEQSQIIGAGRPGQNMREIDHKQSGERFCC